MIFRKNQLVQGILVCTSLFALTACEQMYDTLLVSPKNRGTDMGTAAEDPYWDHITDTTPALPPPTDPTTPTTTTPNTPNTTTTTTTTTTPNTPTDPVMPPTTPTTPVTPQLPPPPGTGTPGVMTPPDNEGTIGGTPNLPPGTGRKIILNVKAVELRVIPKGHSEHSMIVATNVGKVDLLALPANILPAGHLPTDATVEQIRLILNPNGNEVRDGDVVVCGLKVPSLKVRLKPAPFVVEGNNQYMIEVPEDEAKVHVRGSKGCIIRPVARVQIDEAN